MNNFKKKNSKVKTKNKKAKIIKKNHLNKRKESQGKLRAIMGRLKRKPELLIIILITIAITEISKNKI